MKEREYGNVTLRTVPPQFLPLWLLPGFFPFLLLWGKQLTLPGLLSHNTVSFQVYSNGSSWPWTKTSKSPSPTNLFPPLSLFSQTFDYNKAHLTNTPCLEDTSLQSLLYHHVAFSSLFLIEQHQTLNFEHHPKTRKISLQDP